MRINKKNTRFIIAIAVIFIILGCVVFTSDSYRAKRANNYYSNGNYKMALVLYNKIRNTDVDILLKKEKCEFNTADYTSSIKTLDLIEQKFSGQQANDNLETIYYDKAIAYHAVGDYENTIKFSNLYLSTSREIYLNMSIESIVIDSYLKLGKIDECINVIDTYLLKYSDPKFKPHVIELNDILFGCYLSKKDFNNALKINDKLLEDSPDNIQFYIGRSVLYSQQYGKQDAYKYLVGLRDKFKNNSTLESFIKSYK